MKLSAIVSTSAASSCVNRLSPFWAKRHKAVWPGRFSVRPVFNSTSNPPWEETKMTVLTDKLRREIGQVSGLESVYSEPHTHIYTHIMSTKWADSTLSLGSMDMRLARTLKFLFENIMLGESPLSH
jgi:hypothetical protein